MKKILSFLLLTAFLAACAGNPPTWWNPNNRYGTVDSQTAQNTNPQKSATVTEQEIEPLPDVSYEEVTLTPMEDEEGENASGAASGQNDSLSPDANLPVPSVLE